MDEYSIETRSEKIFHSKTKEYFREVLISYQQGNYRSATVMLWSVAVCDLLYKLKHMYDMYGDTIAKGILDELEVLQTKNSRSSEWEFKLVEWIASRTSLLEVQDVDHLSHLQQQRHLAAHPVLSAELELHRPNKDTVRALIRNILDGILSKPPIYTRKVFDEFVKDLDSSSAILIKDETLKSYLESKYFSRADAKLEQSLIRSMWKMVFRLSNPICNKNRDINFRALKLLVSRHETEILNLVTNDVDYYSHLAPSGAPVSYLVVLLSKYPLIYSELSDAAKVVIGHEIDNDNAARCLGWFTSSSLSEHYSRLVSWIEGDEYPEIGEGTITALRNISDSQEWNSLCNLLSNSYYRASRSYSDADLRFLLSIKPYISNYNSEELIDLLSKIELNGQTFERSRARVDHREIKEVCDIVLGISYVYSAYPYFIRSIN